MQYEQTIRRVILVVLDGLRADAIPLFSLPNLTGLIHQGAATLSARTVSPSITAAAMTSMLTGVSPQLHGNTSDRFAIPVAGPHLMPLPRWLRNHGLTTQASLGALPRPFRGLGERIAERAGVTATFGGRNAEEILAAAMPALYREEHGLFILHWPDADRAGHAHGWTSKQYREAARALDQAIARLVTLTALWEDPSTVLIIAADHGGGGRTRNDHESTHPLDMTIPIIMAGCSVAKGELAPMSSLLDIPATIAWLLTGAVPEQYQGRAMVEAMAPRHGRFALNAAR